MTGEGGSGAFGLTFEDGEGQRIRVRKQEDVSITPARLIYLLLICKTATQLPSRSSRIAFQLERLVVVFQ